MSGIIVTLDGTLTLERSDGTGNICAPTSGDALDVFPLSLSELGLTGIAGSSGTEIGQGCFTISSPAAFVALAFPSSMRARLFYFKVLTSATMDVRLTHATAGAVTYPGQYVLLSQFSDAEQVSVIEVQGTGSFTWAAVGVMV